MTHNELTWKFLNEFDVESSTQAKARAISLEHGVNVISPAVGAQLALVAAATNAANIIEIGTGLGLSGLWLLSGAPEATLTSIDPEFEYHEQARELFTEAGYPGYVAVTSFGLYAKAGIDINVVREPNDSYWDNVWIKKPWCQCYWGGRPTADAFLSISLAADAAWNDTRWKNARFNELLVAARSESDEAKRAAVDAAKKILAAALAECDDGGTP